MTRTILIRPVNARPGTGPYRGLKVEVHGESEIAWRGVWVGNRLAGVQTYRKEFYEEVSNERGQTLVEYALIIGAVALVILYSQVFLWVIAQLFKVMVHQVEPTP